MKLPIRFDLTKRGKIVKPKSIGEEGYIENVEYTLQFNVQEDGVYVSYYGDDDTYFDEDRIQELTKN